MSWEDEDNLPQIPRTTSSSAAPDNWEDDGDTNLRINGSWEGEDVEVHRPPPKSKTDTKPKPAPAPKAVAKPATPAPEVDVDPITNKLREQHMVEQADFSVLQDAFGIASEQKLKLPGPPPQTSAPAPAPAKKPAAVVELKVGEDNFDIHMAKPKSSEDFIKLATLIATKLSPYERHSYYLNFVKSLTKQVCSKLEKTDEIKQVIEALNKVIQERQPKKKAALGATSGKKGNTKIDIFEELHAQDFIDEDEEDDDEGFM